MFPSAAEKEIMNTLLHHDIRSRFVERFKKEPVVVRSPGRINLIGEHTDYNDGFVMPAAINKEAVFAIAPSDDTTSIIYSVKFDQSFQVDLLNPVKVAEPEWANYLLGVLYQFIQNGYAIKPFHCVFGGNIPVGAGLSSSAAIECGFGFALSQINQINIDKPRLAAMAQWAEHHYAGVQCGIMDQFASVMGKKDHVVLLDCRSLSYRYFPLPLHDHKLILCDTRVKHSLVDSEYNTRRKECEKGVSILRESYPEIKSLRDVSPGQVTAHKHDLEGKIFDRCLYVTEEIQRVLQAAKDLEQGNLQSFGKKMFETHEGLSKKYEVSCPELDYLVDQARHFENVPGARMMGGGFGGCTINIVKKDFADRFQNEMRTRYRARFSIELETIEVEIEDGTSVVPPRADLVT